MGARVVGKEFMGKYPSFEFSAFVRGIGLPFRGMRFLLAGRGLKRYATLPLIANVVLYAAAITVFLYFVWNWNVYEVNWTFLGPVGGWLSAVVNWMGWLVKLVVVMLGLAAAFFTFSGVGMALASPLNDILSEKVEGAYLGGIQRMQLPFRFTFKAALLSIGDSLRNVGRQLVYTILVLPFLLIPVVGFIPLFLVGAYFAGFGFLDCAMARNFLRPKHKRLLVGKHFWEVLGFGAMMQALFAIPFFGMLLMPVGVTSGTILYCSEDWLQLLRDANMPVPDGFVPPVKSPEKSVAVAAKT